MKRAIQVLALICVLQSLALVGGGYYHHVVVGRLEEDTRFWSRLVSSLNTSVFDRDLQIDYLNIRLSEVYEELRQKPKAVVRTVYTGCTPAFPKYH